MVSAEDFQKVVDELNILRLAIPALQQGAAGADQAVKDNLAKKQSLGYLTDKTSFKSIENYEGKSEKYEVWRFLFAQFLGEEEGWEPVLQAAMKWLSIPTDDMMKKVGEDNLWEERVWYASSKIMSKQLYIALCRRLKDKAFHTAKNLEHHPWSGFALWWKLGAECNANSTQRVQALIDKINHPSRAKKYADVLSAIDDWEAAVKTYEDLRNTKIMEDMKIAALRQIVPADIDRDIYRDFSDRTYEDTLNYIMKQVGIRKEMKPTTGVVPMDVDALVAAMNLDKEQEVSAKKMLQSLMSYSGYDQEPDARDQPTEEKNYEEEHWQCPPCGQEDSGGNPLLSMLNNTLNSLKGQKGGKSFGKGKGFQGNCSHCGKYGHMKKDCRILDAEMNAYRAGQKGKGGQKGFGYQGKSNWNGTPNNGGWNPGKGQFGGYRGNNYNPAKGQGKGYANYVGGGWTNDGWNQNSPPQPQAPTTWTLNSLSKVNQDFKVASKTFKPVAMSTVRAPPGLGQFQALQSSSEEDDVRNFMTSSTRPEVNSEFPAMRMENYSKNSRNPDKQALKIQVARNKAEKKKTWKPVPLNLFQKAKKQEAPLTLSPFIGKKQDEYGYTSVVSVLDSGASESVAPPSMCAHIPVQPSAGSQVGQEYLSASNDLIPNLGEQLLPVITEAGKEGVVRYQIAEVSRPLSSVSEICDAGGPQGQQVVFGKNGGVIVNMETGQETPFKREEGIYVLEMWVKPPADFQRRG